MTVQIPTFVLGLALIMVFLQVAITAARPYNIDSPISRIIVPYQPNIVVGQPYQFPAKFMAESRQVYVPEKMNLVASFNLDKRAMTMSGGHEGLPVNFVDGAYPVYYMPGTVNGKFNGKISLLAT